MRNKQGISLIVLVIIIIVMTILAGAIILTLSNNGIINKASEAVEDNNEAQLKHAIQLAWADAYVNAIKNGKQPALNDLIDAVDQAKKQFDTSEYGILVTTSGVKVIKGWVQDGMKVKKGEQEIEIGSEIAYDETAGGTIEGLKDVNWQILGASDDGELLILSTYESTLSYGANSDLKSRQNQWLNAVGELDQVCKPYGQGAQAIAARSIRIEDIDKVTGFDKTTFEGYGIEATYLYNGTTRPDYMLSNGLSGTTAVHSNGFHYYNGTEFVTANLSTNSGIITKLKNTAYSYDASELDNLDTTSNAYRMLFENGFVGYWLASPYVYLGSVVTYGVLSVVGDSICTTTVMYPSGGVSAVFWWTSLGEVNNDNSEVPVRIVVSLSPTVNLTSTQNGAWKY